MSDYAIVEKPFPNEHAARQTDPGKYDTFRRTHPKGFPAGIDVIFGIKDGKAEIQTFRFDASKWTIEQARKWLKEHSFKATIEAAAKKTVWTAAFVNDLPDTAFAVVLSGGKKDEDEKTIPRSLRKLPHHNASVKSASENDSVDLPHLRNALARLDQSNMPSEYKSKAKSHLMKHAEKLLSSYEAKKENIWKSLFH